MKQQSPAFTWPNRPITRRNVLAGGLGAAAAAILSGCGSVTPGTSGSSEPVASSAPTGFDGQSLSVLAIQDPFFYAIQSLLPEFEQATGAKVNFEGVDYDTLLSRSTNSFTSQQGDIDVITPDSMWLSRFSESNWLTSLDEFIARDNGEVDIADFIPSALYSFSEWRGKLYTLPVATYGTIVLYRPSVFQELGLQAPPEKPSEDWTWDKYLELIGQLNGKTVGGTDMFGTVVLGAAPQPITHMWSQLPASMGGRWVKAFPDAATWDFSPAFDSPQMTQTIDYYQKLFAMSPPEAINYLWFDAGTRFGAGDIGMMYHWTPYAYLVQRTEYMGDKASKIGDDYALGAVPVAPGNPQVSNIGGYAMGIGANSQRKELAWAFVKWASSAATQKKMAMLPSKQFADFTRKSLYADDELISTYPWLPTQLEVISAGNGKVSRPPIKNYSELEQTIGTNLNKMLADKGDPAATAKSIQDEMTKILTEQQYIPWSGESYNDTLASAQAAIDKLSQ